MERIAIGGMAEVFRACLKGDGGFEKHLVIKRILSHLSSDSDFVVMLIDEAKIAVTLTHPNIVQIYDLGKQDGMYYIAMELIEGADLKAVLGRCPGHRMPVAHAVHVLIETLKGLEYAHQKMGGPPQAPVPLNIIHRDVSPPNVLISYEGEVKLVDFGIAKASVRLMETSAGMLKGKFEYMSPEQARGLALDSRTDLFSAGTVLYELLTGVNPFDGQTDLAVLKSVQRARPVPPSKHNPSIPQRLEQIILKALSPEREDRYQTAQDMRRDLTSFAYAAGAISNAARLATFMREILGAEILQGKTVHASGGGPIRVVPGGDPRATVPTPERPPVAGAAPVLPAGGGFAEEDESPTMAGVSMDVLKNQRTYGTVSGVFGPSQGGLTLGDFASAQELLKSRGPVASPAASPAISMMGDRATAEDGADEFDESPTTVRELSPEALGRLPGAVPSLSTAGRGGGPSNPLPLGGALGGSSTGPLRIGGSAPPSASRAMPSPPPVASLTMHPSGIPVQGGMSTGALRPPGPVPSGLGPSTGSHSAGAGSGGWIPGSRHADALAPPTRQPYGGQGNDLRGEQGPGRFMDSAETAPSMSRPAAKLTQQLQGGEGAQARFSSEGVKGSIASGPQASVGREPGPSETGRGQRYVQEAGWASQPIPTVRPEQLPRPEPLRPTESKYGEPHYGEPPTRLDAGGLESRPTAGSSNGGLQTTPSVGRSQTAQPTPIPAEEVTPRPGEIKPLTLGRRGLLDQLPRPWRDRLFGALAGLVPGLLLAILVSMGGGAADPAVPSGPQLIELLGQGESPFVLNDRSVEPGVSRQLTLEAGGSYDLRLGGGWGVRLMRVAVEGAEPIFRIIVVSPGETPGAGAETLPGASGSDGGQTAPTSAPAAASPSTEPGAAPPQAGTGPAGQD